jgi:hypothetical protein
MPFLQKKSSDLTPYQTPEFTWDFYDALNGSDQSVRARKDKQSSVDGTNVDKYLKLTTQLTLEEKFYASFNTGPPKIPPELNFLLQFQLTNGKFEKLPNILRALHLPKWIKFGTGGLGTVSSDWEQCTALAIAYMRQCHENYDQLSKFHDKACMHFSSNELIYCAREIIYNYQYSESNDIPDDVTISSSKTEHSKPKVRAPRIREEGEEGDVDETGLTDEMRFSLPLPFVPTLSTQLKPGSPYKPIRIKGKTKKEKKKCADINSPITDTFTKSPKILSPKASPSANNNSISSNINNSNNHTNSFSDINIANEISPVNMDNDDSYKRNDLTLESSIDNNDDNNDKDITSNIMSPTNITSPKPVLGIDKLRAITPTQDKQKIKAQTTKLQNIQFDLIQKMMEIEEKIILLKECLERCTFIFNNCNTYAERNNCFDEFTATLGDDVLPREGFPDTDWRLHGVKGYRPLVVDFFNIVQVMADARLLLDELLTPEGNLGTNFLPDGNRGRWGLMWEGEDIVLKVLHSLEFLRERREIANWYGRKFYLLANPLALPFSMKEAMSALHMEEKIQEYLATQPHRRVGLGCIGGNNTWQHQKYLLNWKNEMAELCINDQGFNWPVNPNLREEVDNERLFVAISVIYIRSLSTVEAKFHYEKSFISLLKTIRGQSLMKGESGVKPEMKLCLPLRTIRIDTPPIDPGVVTIKKMRPVVMLPIPPKVRGSRKLREAAKKIEEAEEKENEKKRKIALAVADPSLREKFKQFSNMNSTKVAMKEIFTEKETKNLGESNSIKTMQDSIDTIVSETESLTLKKSKEKSKKKKDLKKDLFEGKLPTKEVLAVAAQNSTKVTRTKTPSSSQRMTQKKQEK